LQAVDVAVSPVEKFREYLATKGKRLTPERAVIVEEVFAGHEHFDADQLVDRLAPRRGGPTASRSTVYRTLASLEEAGLLRKVARTNDRDVYEHDYGYPQHDHLICKQCGDLLEFRNEAISTLLEEIAAEYGFRMTGHRLEVYGRCQKCSRPPQRRHHKLNMV
jgi:Fur family transcriptional regulator, ferric uptake regulator